MNLFFVCGAPKSGTTWLQRILDAHPQVSCSGEGHFIERFTRPLTQVVNAYNHELGLEAGQVYEGRPYYAAVPQDALDALSRAFILERLRSRKPGAEVRWLGDKTPRYTHQLDALHRLFPQAKFINIVRDPREAVVSLLAHNVRVGEAEALTPGAEAHRVLTDFAAKGWAEAVAAVDAFAEKRPELVCELSYGALHADPVREIARAFEFLGADSGLALMETIRAVTSFEALSGRKPGAEDLASFYRRGAPGGWADRLDAEALEIIERTCGPAMRRKGFLGGDGAVRDAA